MTALAQNDYLEDIIQHWKHISSIIHEEQLLNGKRQLNITHIKKLAKRFHVTPATFID